MDEPTPAAPPPRAAAPARPGARRGFGVVGGLLVVFALLIVAVAAVLHWVARTESGTAWALAHIPGLKVTGPKGALLGDFDAERVDADLPGGGSVVLLGLAWRGLAMEPAAGRLALRLHLDELRAVRVDLKLPPSKGTPATPPASLRLPIEVDIAALHVGTLALDALGGTPVRDITARIHLGDERGSLHRIDGLGLAFDRLTARGALNLRSDAPFDLSAAMVLSQDAAADASVPTWQANATLAGPLASPRLQARVRAEPVAAGPGRSAKAQSLDLRAVLKPFAAWPLGELQASAQGFDLSALNSALPATALDGQASATTRALDQPADITLELTNAAAGLWNEGRLPVRRLAVDLHARPDRPGTVELSRIEADLGTQAAAAGRVQGQGQWTRDRWTLAATLQALKPSGLDARAAPMLVSGPLNVAGSGSDAKATVDVQAQLAGKLADRGPARDVTLKLDMSVNASRLELREALARAGAASATVSGRATRTADDKAWQMAARAALVDFDPLPWWPGREDSPWRRGPHRLNAAGTVDLQVPDAVPGAATLVHRLAAGRGQANLKISKSVLAGVPLSGDATLHHAEPGAAQATLNFDVDGNTVHAEGRLDVRGSDDAWTLALDAPTLATLTPLWRLLHPGADGALAGAVNAQARFDGRWPELRSSGQAEVRSLRVDSVRVERATARWDLGTRADAPADVQASLTQASIGNQTLDGAQLQLQGTARAHTLSLRASSKSRPPAWFDTVQVSPTDQAAAAVAFAVGNPVAASPAGAPMTVAALSAQGGLFDTAQGSASGWRGTVTQLTLGGAAAGGTPWLRTRDVALEAQWAGGPARAVVQPGRAELLGQVLRWSRIAWQAADGAQPAQLEAQAELDPVPIAPLLARAQPAFGWGGDLTIAGHLDIRSAPSFRADIVLERRGGDLSVTDETGRKQALGLTDLRLGLNAADGVWSFTQGLAGTTLGVAAGAVVARTSPQATWPAPDTPIEGVLELQVANLGTWGTWVPAGWRLGGTLRTSASIGGRFNAPEYTGSIRGQGVSVRNFLQGVNVTDGDVSIVLQGADARIETFRARAGAGTITLDGGASFGDTPKLQLTLVADKFQLLGRVDRRIVTSGQGRLVMDRTSLAFDGGFGIDEGLVDFTRGDAPSLSDDVDVVQRGAPKAPAAAPAGPATAATTRTVSLDLRVDLGEKLRLRGRGIDTGLRGQLRLTAPGGVLAVNGTVSTVDGTYAAYGQKLTIDRGIVAFNGALANPRLDIEATRPNTDIRVGVLLGGTAQNPRVRLFSEPDTTDIDKLSYLVLGRASDGLGRTDTALLQRAAIALFSGEGEGVTDQFTRAIGLDELSLRQSDGDVRETVISLGKQLSRRWYVGYERGLNATTGSWQLIYRIAQRFTLRAQSGLDNSLDVIWTWRWN